MSTAWLLPPFLLPIEAVRVYSVSKCVFKQLVNNDPFSHPRHEELLAKGGLYADMWLKQQQTHDSDSSSDTEAKDRESEKLQPPSTSSGHHGH